MTNPFCHSIAIIGETNSLKESLYRDYITANVDLLSRSCSCPLVLEVIVLNIQIFREKGDRGYKLIPPGKNLTLYLKGLL